MKKILSIIFMAYYVNAEACNKQNFISIFGEQDMKNKFLNHLEQQANAPKYLKSYCPQVKQTCCSKDLTESLMDQFKTAYETTKFTKIQFEEIKKTLDIFYNKQNFFQEALVTVLNSPQIQSCIESNGEDNYSRDYQQIYEDLKKQYAKGPQLFQQIREKMISFYGGTICSICDQRLSENVYWYQDQNGYYNLFLRYSQQGRNQLVNLLQQINEFQNLQYKILQISKIGYCMQHQPEDQTDVRLFDINKLAGQYYEDIRDGLEKCKTEDNLINFLGNEQMSCHEIFANNAPFRENAYFGKFTDIYVGVMKGLKFLSMQNHNDIQTLYNNDHGVKVDWTTLSNDVFFLRRNEQNFYPTEMVFEEKQGFNPATQKFNIKAIQTLIFQNRPMTFGKVMHKIFHI